MDAPSEPDASWALARLRELGQRVTPARRAVLTVLARTHEHLGAAEIGDRCPVHEPAVHRATVYRALATLCELDLVTHTHTSGVGAVYHLNRTVTTSGERHGHLECTRCHRLTDVPVEHLVPLARSLQEAYAFSLEPEHASLLGVCADCRSA